ncbi:excitatory amino acid transporter 3-like [Xenentodon cancila]
MEDSRAEGSDDGWASSRKVFVPLSLLAIALGIVFGMIAKTFFSLSEEAMVLIQLPGITVMQILQCFTIPFFLASLMTGFILVLVVKPGVVHDNSGRSGDDEGVFFNLEGLLDVLRNLSVSNIIRSCVLKYRSKKLEFVVSEIHLSSSVETPHNATDVDLVVEFVDGVNVFGLTAFFFMFGLGVVGKRLVYVGFIIRHITKYAINWILWYLPFGFLFMTASLVIEVQDWETVLKLLQFTAVVLVGLVVHGAVVLPLAYLVFVRRNPFTMIRGLLPRQPFAVFRRSSPGPQSTTSDGCKENETTECTTTSFILSAGADINMDGSALYMVVAAGFIGQLSNINLDLSWIINTGVLAAVASTRFAEIPLVGAVSSLFLLALVGMPIRHAPVLVVVEWLLHLCNNVVNVWSDHVGAAVVRQLSANNQDVTARST